MNQTRYWIKGVHDKKKCIKKSKYHIKGCVSNLDSGYRGQDDKKKHFKAFPNFFYHDLEQ